MPDKTQIFTKYAVRLQNDLQQLHDILELIFFQLSTGGDFSEFEEMRQKLSERIAVQKKFLDLIKSQYPLQIPLHHKLEQEIFDLGQMISALIDQIQPLLAQRREELRRLLSESPYPFRGHKKALYQNHSAPRMLDISL